MGLWQSYRLRLQRKRWRIRAFRKRRELSLVQGRMGKILRNDILLVSCVRNEIGRLPLFLKHYRAMGVGHFLFIDNDSDDGTVNLLRGQPDVSLWQTQASYRRARFGMDWVNWLLARYGHDHWCITADPDELLVFPFCDKRPLRALTDWLDASSVRSFGTMLLDLYPEPTSKIGDTAEPGWFDPGNYRMQKNPRFGNLWIQGGPRERLYFAGQPDRAPALNKIPLVRWHRKFAYVSSTHMLLPRGLNQVFDAHGGEKASGILLHTKLMAAFADKAQEEVRRGQHFANSKEYKAYVKGLQHTPDAWGEWSEKYVNWRQLERLGLMSRGGWA